MRPQEIIRTQRDGRPLDRPLIEAFVHGLVDGSWSDVQVAAMAMAIVVCGLGDTETVWLTQAMTASGEVLDWATARLDGPVLDKHSTGGVGDKVSLLLAPIIAACGGVVPMISGRGLGHTGGTLDKLDSIPGYDTAASTAKLRAALGSAGCAIVGATEALAPADRRLYAVRDATATVESLPLIVASILSKKLAAGLHGLVLDVKVGNGAFAVDRAAAEALGQALVRVAEDAGLPTRAHLTDMNQVLGDSCGNALEIAEVLAFLQGRRREPRLLEVTRALSADLLQLGGLAGDLDDALAQVDSVLADSRALDHFARMVAALGGPIDFIERSVVHLKEAPVQRAATATHAGWVIGMQTRDIGEVVVELGGGRRSAGDAVDHRVGLSGVGPIGRQVAVGEPLAIVHAADEASAMAACARLTGCFTIGGEAPQPAPVMLAQISSRTSTGARS